MINFNKKLLVLATATTLSGVAFAMEDMSAEMPSPYAIAVGQHAPEAVTELANKLHATLEASMMEAMANADTTTMIQPDPVMMAEHLEIIKASLWKAVDIGGKHNTSSVYLDREPANIHMPLIKVFGLGPTPEDILFVGVDMERRPGATPEQFNFEVVGIHDPAMPQVISGNIAPAPQDGEMMPPQDGKVLPPEGVDMLPPEGVDMLPPEDGDMLPPEDGDMLPIDEDGRRPLPDEDGRRPLLP